MPNADDIYTSGGAYLKGEELVGCDDWPAIISGVEIKQFDDGRRKAVLSFEDSDRKLVVNNTNRLMIQEVAGSKETDDWIGVTIDLYATKDSYGGKIYDVVRVRPPRPKTTGKKPAFAAKKRAFDERNPPPFDDELPPGF